METKILNAGPGDYLPNVIAAAIAQSRAENCIVQFEFNGATANVTPETDTPQVRQQIQEQWDKEAQIYHASDAGKRAAVEAQESLERHQRAHDRLVGVSLKDLTQAQLVDWVADFAGAADHSGITGRDFEKVARRLESCGYQQNAATGLPAHYYETPEVMASYIIGQAIDCLRKGLPPHQVTHKFAETYRKLISTRT